MPARKRRSRGRPKFNSPNPRYPNGWPRLGGAGATRENLPCIFKQFVLERIVPRGTRMGRRTFQLLSLVILLGGLLAAIALCKGLIEAERSQLRRTREAEAEHTAAQLRTGVLESLESLTQLAKWWGSQG